NPSNELIVGAISSWVYFIFSLYSMPPSQIYQTIGWVLRNHRDILRGIFVGRATRSVISTAAC
ncbi:MAG: hypothetical protein ACXVIS_05360, partial [Halobacteriota archaeon]